MDEPSGPAQAVTAESLNSLADDKYAGARLFDWRWQAGIFALALVVRGLHLWGESHSPFFSFRGIDALDYHQMALGMHDGTWPDHQPFFWAPLYPMFLGLLYGLVGQGALALKAIQAVFGALSCVLLYRVGRRLFAAPWIAAAAGVAMALYGTLVYFDGELLSANLDVLFQLLALELLLGAAVTRTTGRWTAAGVVMGLSVVNRGAILLLLPLAAAWTWCVMRRGWPVGPSRGATRERMGRAVQAVAGVVLPTVVTLGLAVAHNVRVDAAASQGRMGLLPVAYNLGINFYLGNHWSLRDINKTSHPRHFSHYDEIMQLPVDAGVTGAFAGSQYLFHRTLADIRSDPGSWLRLMVHKLVELGQGREIPRSANLYAHRHDSLVLRALLWKHVIAFPGGLVIPFGLVGLAAVLPQWRRHALVLLAIGTQAAFVLMFFVTARYRLPVMPLLLLYGVAAVGVLVSAWRRGAWGRFAATSGAVAVLMVVCNWGVVPGDD
ncbi:MAG TPA: glycosyltransferase family 39 protein, partial [Phycisphaerae bacterium]|nr:glycosyltransferase family 39 protein [Phycisphaerae bacterium]